RLRLGPPAASSRPLSLPDALPIFPLGANRGAARAGFGPGRRNVGRNLERSRLPAERFARGGHFLGAERRAVGRRRALPVRRAIADRKSTRLNSSHVKISYAVFCLQ